jgi:hypothetical protein
MRLIKLAVPAVLIAVLTLLAPHADAQTMGEYSATTAGAGGAGGSIGMEGTSTSVGPSDIGGGSSTWGASQLGASFDERAGAASPFSAGTDFESRAGSSAGGPTAESRWPQQSGLDADTSTRFRESYDRFPDRTEWSGSADRFPTSSLDANPMGLDTHYNSDGLDTAENSRTGLDSNCDQQP